MEMETIYNKICKIQQDINEYLQNEDILIVDFQEIEGFEILNDRNELKNLLYLISKISNNHRRTNNLIKKTELIIAYYKESMLKLFTNDEIFDIFKNNKRILLFLFKNGIIIPNKSIANIFQNKKYQKANYASYFFKEFREFYEERLIKKIEWKDDYETIEKKRELGENDNFICQIIRNDSIEEFVSYVNQINLSLTSKIQSSIYETNSFLNQRNSSLIEYSVFFGSIQIFNYLKFNKVALSPSLWIYSIHAQNPEIISILEDDDVKPPNNDFDQVIIESIKCHHCNITDYLIENQEKLIKSVYFSAIKYFNYSYLSEIDLIDLCNELNFYNLCKYNYIDIVDFILKHKSNDIDINKLIILY